MGFPYHFRDNGFEDRITLIRGLVEEVELPVEKVTPGYTLIDSQRFCFLRVQGELLGLGLLLMHAASLVLGLPPRLYLTATSSDKICEEVRGFM